jgi:hypothetical protein
VDAFVQLALMAKAKFVFESEGTFLSFPVLSPLSYPPERLKFVKPGGEATPQDLADLSEFARITNRIPRGVLAPEDEGEYVWDVYRDVLMTAQVSSGSVSASEKAKYDEAIAFLYVPGPDGLRRDSAALTAYKRYRDAYIKAQEEYKNRQLTAESSDDPIPSRARAITDVRIRRMARWRNEEEPRLREEIRRIEEAWLTNGYKVQVEAAQQIELTYAARNPSLIWNEWKGSFVADLDMLTDTNNIQYAITGFSPYDLFDHGTWPRFTLTNDEMTHLARKAPPELLTIFASSLANPDIESVSFEYRSVAVTRSWLRPPLFKSRFWRLGAGADPLSDGGTPPKGRCPAYISALVFARNVIVQRRQQQPGAAPVVTAEKSSKLLQLDPNILSEARRVKRSLYPAAAPKPVLLTPQEEVAATSSVTHVTAAKPRIRLEGQGFTAVDLTPRPTPRPIPPPTPQPDAAPSNEITILAFICKGLPRCPDPDPALIW